MSDEGLYQELTNDPSNLQGTIFTALNKIRTRGDLSADTLEDFFNNDPKFARSYFLPNIHKQLHNDPGRSNCSYYTEKILSFVDYHLAYII